MSLSLYRDFPLCPMYPLHEHSGIFGSNHIYNFLHSVAAGRPNAISRKWLELEIRPFFHVVYWGIKLSL